MKVIRELALDAVKKDPRSTISIRISVFIAVILLGSFLIITNNIDYEESVYIKENSADHSAQILCVSPEEINELQNDKRVKSLAVIEHVDLADASFKRPHNEINYFDARLYDYKLIKLRSGRYPEKANELVVSDLFLEENPGVKIGSHLKIADKTFRISGIFHHELFSYEDSYISFGWTDSSKTPPKDNSDLFIWLENERLTYEQIPEMIEKLGYNTEELIEAGGMSYNKAYLIDKYIFPGGLLNMPGEVVEYLLFRAVTLLCLILLFAVIINNAFAVWNRRDLKQIGLLKSCGMSKGQVRQLVTLKALFLSIGPILLGIVASYLVTFLLAYIMEISRAKYSIVDSVIKNPQLHFDPLVLIMILFFAVLTVLLAAMKPAKISSEIPIVNAIKNLDPEQSTRPRNIPYTANIEKSLAREYSSSFRKHYRGMGIAMALACLIFSLALVGQSYDKLDAKYNSYPSPYNMKVWLTSLNDMDSKISTGLQGLKGVEKLLYYRVDDNFVFYESDNPDFLSQEKGAAWKESSKGKAFDQAVSVYGIDDKKWDEYCQQNALHACQTDSFGKHQVLMVDMTSANPRQPYQRQSYIPLSDKNVKDIGIRAGRDGELINMEIAARLAELPFGIGPIPENSIALFMPMRTFDPFCEQEGAGRWMEGKDHVILMQADKNKLDEIAESARTVVHRHIPPSDVMVNTDNDKRRSDQEAESNKRAIILFAQGLLLLIGFSNAYNSFNGNLQARRRDFALLRSIGMQAGQLKKMLYYEAGFLIRRVLILFLVFLVAFITLYAIMKTIIFSPWEIFLNLNFVFLLLFLAISVLGILLALRGGIRRTLEQNITESLGEF